MLKVQSSSLVFDALACLGVYQVPGRRHGTVLLRGKRTTQKERDGVCIVQVFIAWVGSVSSWLMLILDDLNTFTGWGLHDLHELHTHVNRT